MKVGSMVKGWHRLAGALSATFILGTGHQAALAGQAISTPNFSPDPTVGWRAGLPDGLNPIGQEFLPPASGPGPVTFDPAHPYIDTLHGRRIGKTPTLRVADLTNPILQPWVRDELRKVNERALAASDSGVFPTPKERCWPNGVPGWVLYPVVPIYFVQTPTKILMVYPDGPMVRHVYLNVAHSANPKPSWFGESVGHYENGDTLVVDTVGLDTQAFIDNFRTPHTDQLHVVERYRLVEQRSIEVDIYVEDPGAFTTPWSARQSYRRAEIGPWIEVPCENNARFFDYDVEPIPQAERPDF